jgi:hypothetical protein
VTQKAIDFPSRATILGINASKSASRCFSDRSSAASDDSSAADLGWALS